MSRVYTEAESVYLTQNVRRILHMPSVMADYIWAGCVLLDCALTGKITLAEQITHVHGRQFANFFIEPENFLPGARALAAADVKVEKIRFIHMLAATPKIENSNAKFYRDLIRYAVQDVPLVDVGVVKDSPAAEKREAVLDACIVAFRRPFTNLTFLREIRKLEKPAQKASGEKVNAPAP